MPELIIPSIGSDFSGPVRQLERVILDPITEDLANAPLELTGRDGGHGIWLVSHSYPPGDRKRSWAGAMESIGERPVGPGLPSNRQIPYTVWVAEEQTLAGSSNKCTNPKGAIDLTDWANVGAGTMTRYVFNKRTTGIVVPYPNGVSAETAIRLQGAANLDRAYIPFASNAGGLYTASAWVHNYNLGGATGFRLDIRDPSGATVASSDVLTTLGKWTRLFVQYTTPTSDNYRFAFVQVGTGDTNGLCTGVLIERASDLGPYFDGDTPGCHWNAGRHDSVSIRRDPGGSRFAGALHDLEQKLEKLASEGGTIKRVLPSGDELIFDVVDANGLGEWDKPFDQGKAEQSFTITARPYARGKDVALSDHVETNNPVVVGTDTIEQASARSLGRIVIDDDQGVNRIYVVWGAQSRYYDADSEARLLYDAENRQVLNGSVVGALTGSFSGNVVKNANLTHAWAAVMSTRQVAASIDHQHVGEYRFFCRLYLPTGNTGAVSVALQWSLDDFETWTTNDQIDYEANDVREGNLLWADLGVISVPEPVDGGAGKWRGRIVAKSTVNGDAIWIDCYALIPMEVSGELRVGTPQYEIPVGYVSRDDFSGSSSTALSGQALDVGGTWTENGGAGPNAWERGGNIAFWPSSATNDADEDSGGFLTDNGTIAGLVAVQADLNIGLDALGDGTSSRVAVVARWQDTSNYIYAAIRPGPSGRNAELRIYKAVAGTVKLIEQGYVLGSNAEVYGRWHTVRLQVDAAGRYFCWYGRGSLIDPANPFAAGPSVSARDSALIYSGQAADLAAGGALATGRPGIYAVEREGASAKGSAVANYLAFTPTPDAAIFAGQSMEIRSDSVRRKNSTGSRWVEKPEYVGDYCILPPSGREQRTLRTIVLASEGDPNCGIDTAIDDTSFQITLTPQFDVVPEPV